MGPLVTHDAPAALSLLGAMGLWSAAEALSSLTRCPGAAVSKRDRGSHAALGLGTAGALAGAFLACFGQWAGSVEPAAPVFGLGLVLIGAGVTLRVCSIRTLDRYFTGSVAVQPGQQVVSSGPYRYIRHPSYAGNLVALLGLGLALDNWASLLSIAAVLPALAYRIKVEEEALEAALGDPYRAYAARTKRLVPHVL